MALSPRPLYDAMVRQFKTGTSDVRFSADFVYCLNNCLDELSFSAALLTAIGHVAREDESISELDENHGYILSSGLVVKLVESGHRHNSDDAYTLALRQWEERKGDFMVIKSREDQETTDDNDVPTADIWGLGYRGTDTGTGVPSQ